MGFLGCKPACSARHMVASKLFKTKELWAYEPRLQLSETIACPETFSASFLGQICRTFPLGHTLLEVGLLNEFRTRIHHMIRICNHPSYKVGLIAHFGLFLPFPSEKGLDLDASLGRACKQKISGKKHFETKAPKKLEEIASAAIQWAVTLRFCGV